MTERKGVTQAIAKIEAASAPVAHRHHAAAPGEVDGLIVGTWGHTSHHLQYIDQVIGKRAGVQTFACMNGLMLLAPGFHR